MTLNIFRLLASIIFIGTLGISVYFRRKADKDSRERVSWKDEGLAMIISLRLGGLVLWLSTIGYLAYPPLLAWSKIGLPDWARWVGVGLGLLSMGLTYWLFKSIGQGISPTVGTRTNHSLVKTGPYRWVRHPLYSVGTMNFIAFSMIADIWFTALIAGIAFVLLALRTPNEEAHLIRKFGDEYREYMKNTGAFLPKI